jgi:hypothetical protein
VFDIYAKHVIDISSKMIKKNLTDVLICHSLVASLRGSHVPFFEKIK